ncbi:hypothetical protein AVEN_107601-1 [Araneus ventricosus]|uniref:Uncharacterized protein n=1 Tax=Araneus ventricosus TaxID=182803 RepID=A0A4Y2QA83_ARAVE|nr:hypothetical protein AVEN_107601-1 [Araneus ventricosus]
MDSTCPIDKSVVVGYLIPDTPIDIFMQFLRFNPLLPKTRDLKIQERPSSPFKGNQISLPPQKPAMTAGTFQILRKPLYSPDASGRATLTTKVCAVGVKSIPLNERGWKFHRDIPDGLPSFGCKDVWDIPRS